MESSRPSRTAYFLAYAALYSIWGSTYLAIGFTVETIPPFFSGSLRFLIAGSILLVWCFFREKERPTLAGYKEAFKVGGIMLLAGYGGVAWAQQTVPSSMAALIITVQPLWMVLYDWLLFHSRRPSLLEIIGLILGFGGTVFLVLDQSGYTFSLSAGYTFGMVVILFANMNWSLGALYSRKAPVARSNLLATAMQMTAGGLLLLILSFAAGEGSRISLETISLKSALSLSYLVVFGSLMGFTAFIWLMKVDRASRVATHTFVNPIVAILLGWSFGNESITLPMLVAGGVIIFSVALILRYQPTGDSSLSAENEGAI